MRASGESHSPSSASLFFSLSLSQTHQWVKFYIRGQLLVVESGKRAKERERERERERGKIDWPALLLEFPRAVGCCK